MATIHTREADITVDAYELLQRGRDLLARRHARQAAVVLERARTSAGESGTLRETLGRETPSRDATVATRPRPATGRRARSRAARHDGSSRRGEA